MLELKLAYKNLVSAGLRTWLNVAVLSLAYVLIVWSQGIYNGMLEHGTKEVIKDEIAGGQYWHKSYDPYDPLSIDDSHGVVPDRLKDLIQRKEATEILVRQASIYPKGRIQSVLLKGIEPDQKILGIPSAKLKTEENLLPILIGKRMARSISLKNGDYLTIRWRDSHGTFDAVEGRIVEVMNTKVPSIDNGQIWIPLKELQKMSRLKDEATIIVVSQSVSKQADMEEWKFKNHDFLLKDIHEVVKAKRIGASILYTILLFLAMLAIFDTQVLAVFKRKKEIGTLMALGMTRFRVILLFTLEGALNGILAIIMAAIYGIPLIVFSAQKGIKMPEVTDSFGFAGLDRLMPVYSAGLVLGTIFIVMVTITVVSYLPSRKISKLKPTEALRGKLS